MRPRNTRRRVLLSLVAIVFSKSLALLVFLFLPCRAITLDNQLVVLATTGADAGRYHAEAVNEMTGENVTSPAIYLSISGKTPKLSDCDGSGV